jgi:hypothetical protein
MSGETVLRRLAWTVFAFGVIIMSVYYGSTNEPIWPIFIIILPLIVLGGMRSKKSN